MICSLCIASANWHGLLVGPGPVRAMCSRSGILHRANVFTATATTLGELAFEDHAAGATRVSAAIVGAYVRGE